MRIWLWLIPALLLGIGLGIVLASRAVPEEPGSGESTIDTSGETEEPIEATSANHFGLAASWEYSAGDHERYQGWIDAAVARSAAEASRLIIINKSAYRLYLVEGGEIAAEYPVELGGDPVHDKRMEGDNTTPEGNYQLAAHHDLGHTSFHRGYFIDYPNELDRREFARGQADGSIPAGASIGGAIMIHGEGSGLPGNDGGYNWTLGCIALSNADIDELWDKLERGLPVVIVRYGEV